MTGFISSAYQITVNASSVIGGTSGSVLFVNAAGKISQENANFSYSTTTHTLSVSGLATGGIDCSGPAQIGGITTLLSTVDMAATITSYNTIATVGNGVPVEYALVDAPNQIADVGLTTLFGAAAVLGGMYRVSATVTLMVADSVGSTLPVVQIVYTDLYSGVPIALQVTPNSATVGMGQSGGASDNTLGLTLSGVAVINVTPTTDIQFMTAGFTPLAPDGAFSLNIILEKL